MNIADLARENGFNSEQELNRMVVAVDLQRRGALYAFHVWKENDGTKEGLLMAFPETAGAQDAGGGS
ncbi:MAG TPA: hypothetical protein VLK35_02165 [Methylomirabilota bacterium]|nr:hypothetical protein [Methylomirabilota bacterium]